MTLNKQESDVLKILLTEPYTGQRILSEKSGHSLGGVNQALKSLTEQGMLDRAFVPTELARKTAEARAPQRAVILAAGFGMRMVPINLECPKGLIEVHGQPLIERLIRQLHAAGIREIHVVTGFMKERYEYLIDEFGVNLIVNEAYASQNNLHSLRLAEQYLHNSYVVPCDLWCAENPFDCCELYSWYLVSQRLTAESSMRITRKNELIPLQNGETGNSMLGIAYLTGSESETVRQRLITMDADRSYDNAFWEETLADGKRMLLQARLLPEQAAVEINTYEQLRELDTSSDQLKSDAIDVIAGAMQTSAGQITDITVLKKGMTNRSFLFCCRGKKYIMRIPGEGTDRLINRRQEAAVYRLIADRKLCDRICYISPENGYKITEFLENARVCDPEDERDLKACMKKLREFHAMELQAEHTFDIFGQIRFYESLWNGTPSVFRDYLQTREHVLSLQGYIDAQNPKHCLTHIDAVPDNFLFVPQADGTEQVYLIDWEYAGMQDPYVDIAMFCIYAFYDRQQIDHLIDLYFENRCEPEIRTRIYCYVAACGLLWSNWCEYKRSLGVEFGEYSLRQYRYAKEYYRLAAEIIEKNRKTESGDDTACIL